MSSQLSQLCVFDPGHLTPVVKGESVAPDRGLCWGRQSAPSNPDPRPPLPSSMDHPRERERVKNAPTRLSSSRSVKHLMGERRAEWSCTQRKGLGKEMGELQHAEMAPPLLKWRHRAEETGIWLGRAGLLPPDWQSTSVALGSRTWHDCLTFR